jgi:phosphoglycolate phosphatase
LSEVLIFDLDGTLIDSAPDLRTATNKVLAKHGRRAISMEETKQFVGNGAPKLIERAFRATGEPVEAGEIDLLTQEFLAFYDGHEADDTRPYEGVMETLGILKEKGVRMALCTNKPQTPTDNLLNNLEMTDFFEVVLGGDQLERKKPDPQMIHWVLDQMKVPVDKAIMIGDSPNDIDAAKNANMRNVAVSYGYRKVSVEALKADTVIDQFPQLLDIL